MADCGGGRGSVLVGAGEAYVLGDPDQVDSRPCMRPPDLLTSRH